MVIGAQQGFYEAAAQIIPILFLVMAVGEYRLGRRAFPLAFYPMAIYLMAIMVLGEFAALRVLLTDSDSDFLKGLTTLSLVLGFVFVVLRLAGELLINDGPPVSREMGKRQDRLLLGTGLLMAVLAYLMLNVNI